MRRLIYLVILGFTLLLFSSVLAQDGKVKSKYDLTFYGFIKMEAFYDNTEVAKGDWLLFTQPDGTPQSKQDIFSMNARHSRLGLKFENPIAEGEAKISALLEMDFAGGFPNSSTAARQPNPRLRHAWVELSKNNWAYRFGQDWALIAGPFPNTTSFVVGAGKGNLWMRYPQIKITYAGDPLTVAFSINRPMAGNIKYEDFSGGDFDPVGDGERSAMPWLMGRAWYKAGSTTLSASFHYGQEQINDISGDSHDSKTYSVNGDAQFSLGALVITLRGFYGENLNSFFGGVFQGFATDSSSVNNVVSKGGWGQLKYTIDEMWSLTLGGGMDDPDDDYVSRTRNDWMFANVSCNVQKAVTFILEGEYLKTSYKTADAGANTRIQFVTYYKF
jgi:hypothetical protein